jgi:hypothetical protein
MDSRGTLLLGDVPTGVFRTMVAPPRAGGGALRDVELGAGGDDPDYWLAGHGTRLLRAKEGEVFEGFKLDLGGKGAPCAGAPDNCGLRQLAGTLTDVIWLKGSEPLRDRVVILSSACSFPLAVRSQDTCISPLSIPGVDLTGSDELLGPTSLEKAHGWITMGGQEGAVYELRIPDRR